MSMPNGYLYIIKIREFVKSGEDVYKVGRTFDIFQRFNAYPKGSKLLCILPSNDVIRHERILLHRLCNKFKNRRDIGAEYFEVPLDSLLNVMCKCVSSLNTSKENISYKDSYTQTGDENNTDHFSKFAMKIT
jgi:hypothetical protein